MPRNNDTLINLIMASDLSQRLRSALEFGAVVAVLMALTVIAISRLDAYVIQSQVTEAFDLTSSVRDEMVVYRAEHGVWPATPADLANATLSEEFSLGSYVHHLELGRDGALTTVFGNDASAVRLRDRRLTFRPLTLPADPGAPVSWVCGPHDYPIELIPGGIDETDIAPSDLPLACRN